MPVYHKDIFLPDVVFLAAAHRLCALGGRYRLTRHAIERTREKGIVLPQRLPIQDCTIVEVTMDEDCVKKMLVRFPVGEKDMVVALTSEGSVTTVYKNTRDDTHRTLNPSGYVSRP